MNENNSVSIQGFSRLLLNIYRMAQTLPGEEFQYAALECVKEFVPFDTGVWATGTLLSSGVNVHTLHLHNTSMKMMEEYDKVKHLDTAAHEVTKYPKATMAWCYTEFQDPELHRFLDRNGHRNSLCSTAIDSNTKFVAWISLYRKDAKQVYTKSEIVVIDELAAHLMQALAINRVVRMERLVNDLSRERWSVAISDTKGVIYHADPNFLEKTKREFALEGKLIFPKKVVSRFTDGNFEILSNDIVINGCVEKDLVFLKVRDKHPIDTLSYREFVVAKLIADGLTLKDAAITLQRSPETVRTQMRSVFQKLNINKITQLPGLLAMRSG